MTRRIGSERGTGGEPLWQEGSGADLCGLDARLDEALEETFPASDPIAVTPARPTASGESDR